MSSNVMLLSSPSTRFLLERKSMANRNGLYKANKYMGPTSSHQYPSPEQMHFMKLLSAIGGGCSRAASWPGKC